MQNLLGFLLALGHTLAWAGSTIVLRRLATRLDVFVMNGIRAAIGWLFIMPIALISGGRDYQLLTLQTLLYLVGSMVIGGVLGDFSSIFSLKLIGVGRSFPISSSYPLFTLLFGILLLGEKPHWMSIPSTLLVLGGVYLVFRAGEPIAQGPAPPLAKRERFLGITLALAADAFWGLSAVILSMGVQEINGAVANSVRLPVVVLLSLLSAGLRGTLRKRHRLDRQTIVLLVLGGILGYGVAATLYMASLHFLSVTIVSTIAATAPLFAVPLGMIFLDERPNRRTLIGMVLTIIGIILVLQFV